MVAMFYLLDVRFLANRQQCKTYFPWPRGPELNKKEIFSAGLAFVDSDQPTMIFGNMKSALVAHSRVVEAATGTLPLL